MIILIDYEFGTSFKLLEIVNTKIMCEVKFNKIKKGLMLNLKGITQHLALMQLNILYL